jgi:hypothetical protein
MDDSADYPAIRRQEDLKAADNLLGSLENGFDASIGRPSQLSPIAP